MYQDSGRSVLDFKYWVFIQSFGIVPTKELHKLHNKLSSFEHTSLVLVLSIHITSPLLIRWDASQVKLIFFAMSQYDWPITFLKKPKKVPIESPQCKRFYIEVQSSSHLANLNRWKEDNIWQSIWDQSEVLWKTCWGTHWELGGPYLRTLCKTLNPKV